MPVSQSKLARFTPNLGILWILVCSFWLFGSIVANPIIYRLVPSPSRYEIRQCSRIIVKMSTSKSLENNLSKTHPNSYYSLINLSSDPDGHFLDSLCPAWYFKSVQILLCLPSIQVSLGRCQVMVSNYPRQNFFHEDRLSILGIFQGTDSPLSSSEIAGKFP